MADSAVSDRPAESLARPGTKGPVVKDSAAVKVSGSLSYFISGSASSSSLSAIQQELVCSVCLELFNDPVCLNCGHNICYKCAYRLVSFAKACSTLQPESVNLKAEAARQTVENASKEAARIAGTVLMPSEEDKKESMKEKDTIKALIELAEPVDPAIELTCPLCRRQTRLGDVKPNIVLRNMIADLRLRAPPSFMPELRQERLALEKEQEILKEQLRRRPHCGFLMGSELCYKDATVYCADCGSLCEEHSKILHSSGPMRFHKLSTAISPEAFCKTREIIVGSSTSQAGTESGTVYPICNDHGKPLELFCTKCKEAVCLHCLMVGKHNGHPCVNMNQASEQFDEWISDLRKEVTDLLPSCSTVADAYESWLNDRQRFLDEAVEQVHNTFGELMKCAEDHERTVAQHAIRMFDSFDENSRRRTEGVHTIIGHGKELIENAKRSGRMSAFARELLERELNNSLTVLNSVIRNAPKDDAAVLSVEDHRKLLRNMKIVTIARNYRLNSCGSAFPIDIADFLASRSVESTISCEDRSAHDGGAVVDPVRRLIISVSGNCNNGKDVFLIDIDKKTSERLRNIVPFGNHGQYPVFDGDRRVYFFESESRNNDRFGYLDLETKSFTTLKTCPSSFREFSSPCFMDGKVYAVCRDKFIYEYTVETEEWKRSTWRVGRVRIAADPATHSLVVIKKRSKFYMINVETKEETTFPVQPRNFNLGSNQEMLFLRRTMDDFIVIVSLESQYLYAFVSRDNKWSRLNWRDVRNGSAHLVFDAETSAFYYKIDSESRWQTVPAKLE